MPVDNPPYIVGTPSITITEGGSVTISRPAGALTGDYIVVALRGQSSVITADPSSSGFTRLGPAFEPSSAARTNGLYGRPITNISTEPSSYTFTLNSSGRIIASAIIVRDVDLVNPIAGYFDSYSGVLSGVGTVQANTYVVSSSPTLSILYAAAEFTATNGHVPTEIPGGYTEVTSAVSGGGNLGVSRTYMYVGARQTSDVSIPQARITWGSPVGRACESISLRGTMGEPISPRGEGFASANGNGQSVRVYYTIGNDDVRTPSALFPIRRGFDTIAQMLATPGFTWAHRGGSASWPEMSLHAYTQSVARGYGVLEVSLNRTSDGVWVGTHDQTTDRASGGTYGNVSDQTWAQIQQQQIVIGSQDAPQPYMRWEEIVAAYGSTHLLVVDPKYALGTHRTEFLEMVRDSVGTERAIMKFSGSGSGAANFSDAAQAMGFTTWGYFYAPDASTALGGNNNVQTWQSHWSLLGMDYTAPQAVWDEILAFGKPVIAHIVPNQAAYNLAMSKGAAGVQVSGVGIVEPVSWWTQ